MNIVEYLERQGIHFERLSHPPTYTAQDLAATEHVPGRHVAKPVLAKADGQFVLCVVPAPNMVDLERVADVLGAEAAELASEEEMQAVFADCELGAEPPFGHLFGLRTLMDERLCEDEYLVFQAGTHNQAIRMSLDDYQRLATPDVVHLARQLV